MKILILANNDGGLYKFRKELIERLVKDNEVYICLPNGEFITELVSIGAKFVKCNLLERHGTNPFKEYKLMLYYKKILKQYQPDFVFTYTIKCNVYGGIACGSLKIPYVANITGLGTAVENPGILQKISLMLYRRGLKNAQKVFFQNSDNMNFMVKKKIIKGDYDLLPGSGVNLNEYMLIDYPESETVDFLFVARVMKAKGIDQYLEAARYITHKYPYTRFHICGSYEQDYRKIIEELQKENIIIYHGVVKDIVSIHKISSCTIHPTYYPEGMSNVLLESCACGRPIITTNRSGCREIIDDGINGYIVNQKDSKDLIEKIEKFLSLSYDERRAMGLAGRAKVEKEFDRQIVVSKYINELKMYQEKNWKCSDEKAI